MIRDPSSVHNVVHLICLVRVLPARALGGLTEAHLDYPEDIDSVTTQHKRRLHIISLCLFFLFGLWVCMCMCMWLEVPPKMDTFNRLSGCDGLYMWAHKSRSNSGINCRSFLDAGQRNAKGVRTGAHDEMMVFFASSALCGFHSWVDGGDKERTRFTTTTYTMDHERAGIICCCSRGTMHMEGLIEQVFNVQSDDMKETMMMMMIDHPSRGVSSSSQSILSHQR